MSAKIYWLHAISPLHVGSGRGVGFIDLPISREKVTQWPVIPGSAVKGVLRDYFEQQGNNSGRKSFLKAAFGEGGEESANAGALVQTDARIVCLPVRSLYGTFAWISSPMVLNRLKRDAEAAGVSGVPEAPSSDPESLHHPESGTDLAENGTVYLEDLDLKAQGCPVAESWSEFISSAVFEPNSPWKETFKKRFAVVPDDIFDYLSEFGTQVNARIRIDDDKKTVQKGALWYEEALPAETILAGLAWVDRLCSNGTTQEEILREITGERHLQMGGNATTGMGRVRYVISGNGQGGGA